MDSRPLLHKYYVLYILSTLFPNCARSGSAAGTGVALSLSEEERRRIIEEEARQLQRLKVRYSSAPRRNYSSSSSQRHSNRYSSLREICGIYALHLRWR